jgi:RNA polymerase sigma-70 factor (sigma-E family)
MVTAKGEFRDFVHEYGDRLARVAWMLTIDRDAVPDVVQTALVKTFVHWSRARATDPYRYARRALVTTVIDRHRREQQHGRALSILRSDARDVSGPAEQVELRSDIASALATLAPRQRAVVALKYIDDLSERDIAKTLGISVGTVKSTVSRALPLLRTALTVEEAW